MERLARISTADPRQVLCGALIKGQPACAGILGTVAVVQGSRVLVLPADFRERGGVWMLSREAHERIRLGLAPLRPTSTRIRTPQTYPARVRCPHCGHIAVVDQTILGMP